jgi:uncharacterized protein (TIGR03435 family)
VTTYGADAQTPPLVDAPPFVASVKPNRVGGRFQIVFQPGGRLTATNVPLRQLIEIAYQIHPFQIEGDPNWLAVAHFDIVAKAEGSLQPPIVGTPNPMQFILRALLADRFRLAVHDETKEMPIYALVRARRDDQLGPQLHASTMDCTAIGGPAARGGPPPQPPGPNEPVRCGLRADRGGLQASSRPLSQLAQFLSQTVQRLVVDRTDLMGNFDFDLRWTPDQMPQGGDAPGGAVLPPIDSNRPALFTALQEQLGLRLESTKGPVRLLVIDHVERPTSD